MKMLYGCLPWSEIVAATDLKYELQKPIQFHKGNISARMKTLLGQMLLAKEEARISIKNAWLELIDIEEDMMDVE